MLVLVLVLVLVPVLVLPFSRRDILSCPAACSRPAPSPARSSPDGGSSKSSYFSIILETGVPIFSFKNSQAILVLVRLKYKIIINKVFKVFFTLKYTKFL